MSLVVVEVSSDQKLESLEKISKYYLAKKMRYAYKREGMYMIALNDTPEPVSPEKWCQASGFTKSRKVA